MYRHTQTDSVGAYLREIGKLPLLSPEQEISLAQQVRQLIAIRNARKQSEQELGRKPSTEEVAESFDLSIQELLKREAAGLRAQEKMVSANLRLVVTIAKKYRDRGLDFLDLIQEGNIGLHEAVEKFDPSRGYRFSTYAYWWIRQAITRALALKARAVRLPLNVTEKLNKIKKVARELTQRHGRIPTKTEVAAAIGVTLEEFEGLVLYQRESLSLNHSGSQDTSGDIMLLDIIPDNGITPEDYTEELEFQDSVRVGVREALARLSPIPKAIIEERFGIGDNGKKASFSELASRYKGSREGIRRKYEKGLKYLKPHLRKLADYCS